MDYILRETDLDCLSHIIQGLALFEHPRYSPYLTVMNSCLLLHPAALTVLSMTAWKRLPDPADFVFPLFLV